MISLTISNNPSPLFCVLSIVCLFHAGGQTAWTMLSEEKFAPRITTSYVDLDNILGGGINCKEVSEIG